jgi:NAD-dependent deacetylase
VLDHYIESGEVPRCPECGGILKPGAVLFGEELPYAAVREARDWIAACDLLIVVGSSLEVTPVAFFPVEALNAGAHLIIVNRDRTYVDERAAAVFHQDVALVLPRLAEEVLGE